jgi:uncharacterized hydrophobic protein (TIGR00271 family)
MKLMLFVRRIIRFISLESELESPDIIHEEIEKGIVFKGTNLWILVFAIVVASVGLNMNSTAVIIGAMLISPLMGPINGMGYSIATYDLVLFKRSVKNFSFSVIASIIASTTYFALSPVSTAHSELLARTSPTIYDVLIALFGGLAGIVAISSKNKGNVIPGVAIATALMPPLCTAGYGLATGQFNYFLGASYLFTINSIFIAFAAVWISQILKFPIRGKIDSNRKKKINRMITAVITIVLLPSIYFGYQLVQQEKFIQYSNQYISNISLFEGNYLLKNKISAKMKTINLVYGGNMLSDNQKKTITERAKDFGLKDAIITIEQGLTFVNIDEKNVEMYKLKEQINSLNLALGERESQLDSIVKNNAFGKIILDEISTIFPQVIGCSYAETISYQDSIITPYKSTLVVLTTKKEITDAEKTRIHSWLKKRLNRSIVRVIYEKD